MKRFYLLFSAALLAFTGAFAQTYKLTDMSPTVFAQGGDAQWSFQKYEYGTGTYSSFSVYGDSCTCNYLDWYNPERVEGNRIVQIDGYTGTSVENYWAANIRPAWYDQIYSNVNTDNLEKFIYMCEDTAIYHQPAFETYAQPKYAGVVSFTVPEDGYYTVNGTIVREDCSKMAALYLIPRYRIQGVATVDSAISLGLAFPYGDQGGVIDGASNYMLPDGAEQRYVAQTPVDYTMAFYGKKGDIISFETNAAKNYGTQTFARACWGRSFYKKLDIAQTDSTSAVATENYVNPYDTKTLDAFTARLSALEDYLSQLESTDSIGGGYGTYTSSAYDTFLETLSELENELYNGDINSLNASTYMAQLESAWQEFLASKTSIDYTADGNYVLFSSDKSLQSVKGSVESNDDSPWGFYTHSVSAGTYTKFSTYTTTAGGELGWCNSSSDWLFVDSDGYVHPTTALSPTIMFTAPEDGYYRVGISLYRPNPNTNIENPLYLRTRFVDQSNGTLSCPIDEEMYSKQYGSVANDGQSGRAPIDMDFFVNMKKGDKITSEIDAYTSKSNGSAGTDFTRLVIARNLGKDTPITKDYIESSGLDLYDPYKAADMTELKTLADSVKQLTDSLSSYVGDGEGQYSEVAYDSLITLYEQAETYLTNTTVTYTQSEIDAFTKVFKQGITDFLSSRKPYTVTLSGTTAIRVAGTQKYLTQKNLASDDQHYYGGFMTFTDIVNDTIKNSTRLYDYEWTFTVAAHDEGGYNLTDDNGLITADGYVTKTADNPTDQLLAARLEFLKENPEDSVVAIRRLSDSLYWNTSFYWANPYDKVSTSSTPVYGFILGDAPAETPTNINGVIDMSGKGISKVAYYTVDGRKLSHAVKGLVIKRTEYEDGTVKTQKLIVR